MDGDRFATARPADLHEILLRKARQIRTQLLSAPSLRRGVITHAQPPSAREAGRDENVALTGGTPQTGGSGPPVQQHRGARPHDGLEGVNERVHQHNRALEHHLFALAHLLLPIHLRSQGTSAIQPHGASGTQALADETLVMGRRMMRAQAFHRADCSRVLLVGSSPLGYPITKGSVGRPRRCG